MGLCGDLRCPHPQATARCRLKRWMERTLPCANYTPCPHYMTLDGELAQCGSLPPHGPSVHVLVSFSHLIPLNVPVRQAEWAADDVQSTGVHGGDGGATPIHAQPIAPTRIHASLSPGA